MIHMHTSSFDVIERSAHSRAPQKMLDSRPFFDSHFVPISLVLSLSPSDENEHLLPCANSSYAVPAALPGGALNKNNLLALHDLYEEVKALTVSMNGRDFTLEVTPPSPNTTHILYPTNITRYNCV